MSAELSVEQVGEDRLADIQETCITLARTRAYPSFFWQRRLVGCSEQSTHSG